MTLHVHVLYVCGNEPVSSNIKKIVNSYSRQFKSYNIMKKANIQEKKCTVHVHSSWIFLRIIKTKYYAINIDCFDINMLNRLYDLVDMPVVNCLH